MKKEGAGRERVIGKKGRRNRWKGSMPGVRLENKHFNNFDDNDI